MTCALVWRARPPEFEISEFHIFDFLKLWTVEISKHITHYVLNIYLYFIVCVYIPTYLPTYLPTYEPAPFEKRHKHSGYAARIFQFPGGFFCSEISSLKYSFVHADFDLYKPTLEVIKFVIPRLEKNAILLMDDYNLINQEGVPTSNSRDEDIPDF